MLAFVNTFAEVFPVKTYTTADGLLRNDVIQVKQDSHGFLWFRMLGQLARFDGYSFTNYTMEDGLPLPFVNWITETSGGTIWFSTGVGIVKFNPNGIRQKFDKNNPANPESMFQVFDFGEAEIGGYGISVIGENNSFWVTSNQGLLKIDIIDGQPKMTKTVITESPTSLRKDQNGNLWMGIRDQGLIKLQPDGRILKFTDKNGIPTIDGKRIVEIAGLLADRTGRIWIGGRENGGLCRLVENPQENQNVIENCYTRKDGLATDGINNLFESSDGIIWIPGTEKVTQFLGFDENKKAKFRILDAKNGLTDKLVWDVFEDRDGNFWIATKEGVKKILKQGFTQYNKDDGLPETTNFNSIFQNNARKIVVTNKHNKINFNVFDDGRFTNTSPNYPKGINYWGYGETGSVLQTQDGECWVTVGVSPKELQKFDLNYPDIPVLIRFPKADNLSNVKPKKIYYSSDFPDIKETFQMFEDSKGDIWIVAFGKTCFLYRWNKKTDTFSDFSETLDLGVGWFKGFAEDSTGNLWFGGIVRRKSNPDELRRLVRYKNGIFQTIQINEISRGMINSLFVDSRNRLWIATTDNGLLRVDDVNAEKPNVVSYTVANGISDNVVFSIAEDKFGRIYAGTGHGVDQINLETGQIRIFTTKDGLPLGNIFLSKTDVTDAIWFGSQSGIARFVPEVEKPRQTPHIYISGLRVAGDSQKISELGESFLPDAEFTSDKNNLAIDYLGLGASLGEDLKYQYQLGDENSEWITTKERTLNFANLSAGDYKFAVRAITSDGLISPNPATFSFKILRPIYLRWWFLILSALVVGLAIRQLYRVRVRRLLEIERTRTRIATDLHDDIGADLSKISLLSEVVKMQMKSGNDENNRLLTKIAETSRKSVDSMRDIVWAINPSRDSLNDLVGKMRLFAEETLVEKNIKLVFNAPNQKLKLSMDTRRELYLIFKEAVTNASNYAECSQVEINFEIIGKEISLTIKDNGKGFDVSQESEGNGLKNMKRRCENLKGKFEIDSTQGTKISVNLPQN